MSASIAVSDSARTLPKGETIPVRPPAGKARRAVPWGRETSGPARPTRRRKSSGWPVRDALPRGSRSRFRLPPPGDFDECVADFAQQFKRFAVRAGWAACRRGRLRRMLVDPAHLGIQKIAELVGRQHALDGSFGVGAAGGGLYGNGGQAHPALQQIARQVNVLDPAIRKMDLAAEQDPPTDRNALVVETVAQGFVLEPQGKDRQ